MTFKYGTCAQCKRRARVKHRRLCKVCRARAHCHYCEAPATCRGLCGMHYQRWKRGNPLWPEKYDFKNLKRRKT